MTLGPVARDADTAAFFDATASGQFLCIAELAEGLWWWTRLEDADSEALTVGAPLRIAYRQPTPDSEVVPVFVPVGTQTAPG
jgi:hypothetical protein